MSKTTPAPPGHGTARRQLALLVAAFVPLFAGPGALQLYLRDLYEGAGQAAVSAAVFLAVAYSAMGVHRLLVGWTVRRLGDRAALLVGALGYVFFAAAQWPGIGGWWLVLVAAAFGWCGSWVWLVTGATVLDLSRRAAFGRAVGLLYCCSAFGQAVGVALLGLLIAAGAPRGAVLVALGLGVAAVALLASRRPPPVRREPVRVRTLLRFARDPRLVIVGLFLMVGSMPFGLILGAFRDHVSRSAEVWQVLPWFFLARSVLALVGGSLVDRLGRGRALIIGFAIGAIALAAVPWLETSMGLAVAALAMGVQVSLIPVAGTALVGDITASPERPIALGVLFFWRDVGAVVGILGGAEVSRHFGAGGWGFLVFAGVLAVFAGLAVVLSRRADAPASGPEGAG